MRNLLFVSFVTFFGLLSNLKAAEINTISDVDSLLALNFSQVSKDLYHSKQVFEQAVEVTTSLQDELKLAELFNTLGVIHHMLNKQELAIEYFNKSILLYERNQNEIGAGNSYAEMGSSMRRRDIKRAKTFMEKGISILERNNANTLESAYDNYGVILHELNKPDSALIYYNRSLDLKTERRDSIGIPYSLQKIAMVNTSEGEIESALNKLDNALEISENIKDSLLICETYTYFGDVYAADESFKLAAENYETALKIAQKNKYNYLINYIYNELPDIYHALGEKDKAFELLKEGNALRDSVLNVERVRSIAELEMFYESTQKEQQIKLLEQEVQISELNLQQNRRVLYGMIFLGLLLVALIATYINRQKLKHKAVLLQQSENLQRERLKSVIIGEEQERERLARELHDGLGQLLSAAKMHVSALEEDVKKELKQDLQNSIKLVDQACVEVRQISHALLPKRLNEGELDIALLELKETIQSSRKFQFNLKTNGDFTDIKGQEAVAVYRIVQELVNNTIKHSNANIIHLSINSHLKDYTISYSDNGKNFDLKNLEKGNGIGWENIYSRLDLINGEITISDTNGAFSAVIKAIKKEAAMLT